MGTYSAIMVTNLTEAEVDGRHLTENWVGVLGIVSSLVSTTASLISGREEAATGSQQILRIPKYDENTLDPGALTGILFSSNLSGFSSGASSVYI